MRIGSYLLFLLLAAFLAGLAFLPDLTSAEEAKKVEQAFKYVGVAGCKSCHQTEAQGKIYATWSATAHAKAFDNLGEANQKNADCLACHTTGHGKAMAAGKTAEAMKGVQCEACHGPGSAYKDMAVMKNKAEALKNGLIEPGEKVCAGCHKPDIPKGCWGASETAPKFDFAAAYKKIEHHVPKPAAPLPK